MVLMSVMRRATLSGALRVLPVMVIGNVWMPSQAEGPWIDEIQ